MNHEKYFKKMTPSQDHPTVVVQKRAYAPATARPANPTPATPAPLSTTSICATCGTSFLPKGTLTKNGVLSSTACNTRSSDTSNLRRTGPDVVGVVDTYSSKAVPATETDPAAPSCSS
mmetsp:Transcript_23323/g.47608  ORF Transcript_23323/g.47608 Transcript_23323/m.47608 type:complete len:118 (-) Transcript_23323:1162-1515(-)